jgi:hypothetical protein
MPTMSCRQRTQSQGDREQGDQMSWRENCPKPSQGDREQGDREQGDQMSWR